MPGEQFVALPPSGPVFFGPGEVARTGSLVRSLGASRAFVVCDGGIAASALLDLVQKSLKDEGLDIGVFDRVTPSPGTADIESGSEALRGYDLPETVVVAVGGGSSLDAAKGIALHAANPGPVESLHFTRDQEQSGLPVIAVPTTAGTGSETNYFGVITDSAKERKFYIGHPSVRPQASILDPLLTVKLPVRPTAATGMDTLVHALEALMSRNANPYAEGLSLQAIRMVNRWLPVVLSDGENVEARSRMLLASHIAGRAFSSGTGLGLCHALAHSISSRLGTAHGVALTIVLPHVLEFNLPVSFQELALAASSIEIEDTTASEEANARSATISIKKLARNCIEEQTLADLGVKQELIPVLARDTVTDPVLGNTPRTPSHEEVQEILVSALDRR